jgi:hypothetical protein
LICLVKKKKGGAGGVKTGSEKNIGVIGGLVQAVEHLPGKHENLSSNDSTAIHTYIHK